MLDAQQLHRVRRAHRGVALPHQRQHAEFRPGRPRSSSAAPACALRLYGGYGEANPSDFLRDVGYRGLTTTFGVAGTYPLIRARAADAEHRGLFRRDRDRDPDHRRGPNGPASRALAATRSAWPASAPTTRCRTCWSATTGRRSTPSASALPGHPFLGATRNGNPPRRAARAGGLHQVRRRGVARADAVPAGPGPASRCGAADRPGHGSVLPPSEKFFLGGTEFNRGFYSGEVTGDNALSGRSSCSSTPASTSACSAARSRSTAQFYAFYDRGETWENQAPSRSERLLLDPRGSGAAERHAAIPSSTSRASFATRGCRKARRASQPLKADAVYLAGDDAVLVGRAGSLRHVEGSGASGGQRGAALPRVLLSTALQATAVVVLRRPGGRAARAQRAAAGRHGGRRQRQHRANRDHHHHQPVQPARRDRLARASTSAANQTVQFNQPSGDRGHAEPGDRPRPVRDRRPDHRQWQHHHHQPVRRRVLPGRRR